MRGPITFKALPSCLVQEQLLLTVVWDVSWKGGDLADRVDLVQLVFGRKQLVLVLVRGVSTFTANGAQLEDCTILAHLLLLPNGLFMTMSTSGISRGVALVNGEVVFAVIAALVELLIQNWIEKRSDCGHSGVLEPGMGEQG